MICMILDCLNTPKSFWPTSFVEWIQLLSFLLSGIGIFIAGLSYASNKKIKRAEWLKSLFEKFYENDFYKDARKWVDFDKDYKLLQNAFDKDENHENEEKFADFLNFFGFIATLEKQKQIKLEEIKRIFGYYLNLIKSNPTCQDYIIKYEYINLQHLLSKL